MVVIVDYQCGNIGSVKNMLSKLGAEAVITSDVNLIEKASKIILPGVGAFDYGMNQIASLGLLDVLHDKVINRKTPVLGICLGAQLMCESSEEGSQKGLGWIKGVVKKFASYHEGKKYPVPHIGWVHVQPSKDSLLFKELDQQARFYFVHSFYIQCSNESNVLAKNHYPNAYHSAFENNNIVGVQFHPEKSHRFGKQLLKNFIEKY